MTRIVFYVSDKLREHELADAFLRGAKLYGVDVEKRMNTDISNEDHDYACMMGVKSKILWDNMKSRGITPIMFDKGYVRNKFGSSWRYWRVSVGSHNPSVEHLSLPYSPDRFERLNLEVDPWRKRKVASQIVFAGSSLKYHDFYELPHPTQYAKVIVKKLRKLTRRPIIYRPKPSWRGAIRVEGATFSQNKNSLADDLQDAHCLVTHGSNACFDAALMGIPSVVLGEGVMKAVSSTSLFDVEAVAMAPRQNIFNALAYHQWTLEEMSSGMTYEWLRRIL